MYSRQCYLWSKNCLQILKPEHVNVNNMLLLLMTVIVNLFALQGLKLTVVWLSRTTKITMGQPNCANWLPLGQPNLSWH